MVKKRALFKFKKKMAEVLSQKQRKKRKTNFSVSEINVLTYKLEENINILQSKFTNAITNQRKNKIWKDITTEVNSLGVANRTTQEVKDKWKNLQSTAKKTFSDIRRQEMKTGGGPPPKEASHVTEQIIKMFETTPLFTGLDGFETAGLNTSDNTAPCTIVSLISEDDVNTASENNIEQAIPEFIQHATFSDGDDENEVNILVPESLPIPALSKPALPFPRQKEKKRRIRNQDVLQLHADVLQSQKEVMKLKKQKLELQISLLQRQVNLDL